MSGSPATCCHQEHAQAFANEAANITKPGGWLDKAVEARNKGAFGDFVKQLMTQLGPILGQIILGVINGLLPHIPPVTPPAGK